MLNDAILFPQDKRVLLPALTQLPGKLADTPPCHIRLDVCRDERDTVVWCHSNLQRHGKGVGLTAHDCFGCFGCYRCHHEIDHGQAMPREMKEQAMQLGMDRSLLWLWKHGLLKVVTP